MVQISGISGSEQQSTLSASLLEFLGHSRSIVMSMEVQVTRVWIVSTKIHYVGRVQGMQNLCLDGLGVNGWHHGPDRKRSMEDEPWHLWEQLDWLWRGSKRNKEGTEDWHLYKSVMFMQSSEHLVTFRGHCNCREPVLCHLAYYKKYHDKKYTYTKFWFAIRFYIDINLSLHYIWTNSLTVIQLLLLSIR